MQVLQWRLAMPARLAKPVETYQIKVTLRGSHPPIWRRIQVRSDTTSATARLTRTTKNRAKCGTNESTNSRSGPSRTLRVHVRLRLWRQLAARPRDRKNPFAARKHPLPLCLAGARACPPEDVGGLPGYENFLEAMRDPGHPEKQEFVDWIGGTLNPGESHVDEVIQKLRSVA